MHQIAQLLCYLKNALTLNKEDNATSSENPILVREEGNHKPNEESTLGGNVSRQFRYLSHLAGLEDYDVANRSSAALHEERMKEATGKRSSHRVSLGNDTPSDANHEERATVSSGDRVPLGDGNVALDKREKHEGKASDYIKSRPLHGGYIQSFTDNVISENNLDKQCKTHRIQSVENELSLADYTLRQLIQMKEDVEELYGNGIFEKHVGLDIVRLLELNKVHSQNDDAQNTVEEVNAQKKSFASVVKEGMESRNRSQT